MDAVRVLTVMLRKTEGDTEKEPGNVIGSFLCSRNLKDLPRGRALAGYNPHHRMLQRVTLYLLTVLVL